MAKNKKPLRPKKSRRAINKRIKLSKNNLEIIKRLQSQ